MLLHLSENHTYSKYHLPYLLIVAVLPRFSTKTEKNGDIKLGGLTAGVTTKLT